MSNITPILLWSSAVLMFLATLPHYWTMSPWITSSLLFCFGLRALFWPQPDQKPPSILLLSLTLAMLGLIILVAQWTESRQFGVALLISIAGVKFLETKNKRDLYIVVFMTFFLLTTLFLFYQSPLISLWALILIIALIALLIALNRLDIEWRSLFRSALILVLSALPVMVILFIFFPRLEGPLWKIEFGHRSGLTGISDQINMGSISQLIQSDEVAFRVRFKNQIPPPEQRYWRGLVLWKTDGRRWQRVPHARPVYSFRSQKSVFDYQINMEPSGQPWLFPLDHILRSDLPQSMMNTDGELIRQQPIHRRLSFNARSSLSHTAYLSDREWQLGLQLPKVSPRLIQLTQSWQQTAHTDEALIEKALHYYRQNQFIYTLNPPILDQPDPIAQFLFDTRQGFCEHYAASLVILLRLMDIPARLIIGYQGGEWNPIGHYFTIRQSDAHAWVEAWLEQKGWVRIDPTAVIAPERIRRSINTRRSQTEKSVVFGVDEDTLIYQLAQRWHWLKDSLAMGWRDWVLAYNRSKQNDLWAKLGLQKFKIEHLSMAAVLIALAISVWLFYLFNRRQSDPVQSAYRAWIDRLNRSGLNIPMHYGPLAVENYLIRLRPEKARFIQSVTRTYIALRYAPKSSVQLKQLQKNIRSCRI